MVKAMQVGYAGYVRDLKQGDDVSEYQATVERGLQRYIRWCWLRLTTEPKLIIHYAGTSGTGYIDPLDMVGSVGVKAWAQPKRPYYLAYLLIGLYKALHRVSQKARWAVHGDEEE